MSESNPPDNSEMINEDAAFDEDQELAIETLPILRNIHARLTHGLAQTTETVTIDNKVKAVFDGALYAHDQARTQDWPSLETQLEDVSANAIMALVLLRRRHLRT